MGRQELKGKEQSFFWSPIATIPGLSIPFDPAPGAEAIHREEPNYVPERGQWLCFPGPGHLCDTSTGSQSFRSEIMQILKGKYTIPLSKELFKKRTPLSFSLL